MNTDFMITNHQKAEIKLRVMQNTGTLSFDDKLLKIGLSVQVNENEVLNLQSALPMDMLMNEDYLESTLNPMVYELAFAIAKQLDLLGLFKKQLKAAKILKE